MYTNQDEIITIYVNCTKKIIKVGDEIIQIPEQNIEQPVENRKKNIISVNDLITAKNKICKNSHYFTPKNNIQIEDLLKMKNNLKKHLTPVNVSLYIPDEPQNIVNIKDYGYYKKLVTNDPEEIKDVPVDFLTKELCIICVKQNGYMLKHIIAIDETITLKYPEIILEAVTQNGLALQFSNVITREICQAAILQNSTAIEFVPYNITEHCKYVVENDPTNLRFFTNYVLDQQIYADAVKKNGFVISYIPSESQTIDLCVEALTQNIKYAELIKNKDILLIIDAAKKL